MINAYHQDPALGSSVLAAFIDHPDKVALEVEPTGFMEVGNIFESLVEEETTGDQVFSDKYFKSDMELKPDSAAWKKILPLFEREQPPTLEEIESLYIRTKSGDLHGSHKNLHRALDQIKAHDFRRLVPANIGEACYAMMENFKRVRLREYHNERLFDILQNAETHFQVERFWKHESGQDCKLKDDIEASWCGYALNADIKVTANWPSSFISNWKKKYIWQYSHYSDGFGRACREAGLKQLPMLYVICESTPPYLVNPWWLKSDELDRENPYSLILEYDHHVENYYNWKQSGSPVKGYREQQTVDRFGRAVEI